MTFAVTVPQTNFLFWNLNKTPITQNIVRAVTTHAIDILLIAETAYKTSPNLLLQALNDFPRDIDDGDFTCVLDSSEARVQLYSRLKNPNWQIKVSRAYYDIWEFFSDAGSNLFLAAVHFPSIQVDQGDGQRRVAIELKNDLQELATASNKVWEAFPVVVCGDFNANPFDPGISGVYGMNASLSREIVQRSHGIRILDQRSYPYFYNPMWRLLGGKDQQQDSNSPPKNDNSSTETSSRIYGTYYDSGLSKSVDYYWYTLDQILVSPSLLRSFRDEDMNVLTRDAENGGVSLVSRNGIPRTPNYPDHLPLFFRLSL